MIYIETNNYQPDAEWLQKSEEILTSMMAVFNDPSLGEEEKFRRINDKIDRNKGHWTIIKEDLLKLSYRKCWYSDVRELFSHYHVEHFRPKKECVELNNDKLEGYWWLAFDYENYCVCGSVGNTTKGNKFAVKSNKAANPDASIEDEVCFLLSPKNKEDVRQITFNENGEAKPSNPDKNAWNYIRADYTISTLKLDYDVLQDERKRVWGKMSDLIQEINELDKSINDSPSATKLTKLEGLKNKVREKIAPCEELSSTNRACLRASGEDWAYDILGENLNVEEYCSEYL